MTPQKFPFSVFRIRSRIGCNRTPVIGLCAALLPKDGSAVADSVVEKPHKTSLQTESTGICGLVQMPPNKLKVWSKVCCNEARLHLIRALWHPVFNTSHSITL